MKKRNRRLSRLRGLIEEYSRCAAEVASGSDRLELADAYEHARTEMNKELKLLEQLIEDAYDAGWSASGEGWNDEYPEFDEEQKAYWHERKAANLAAIVKQLRRQA